MLDLVRAIPDVDLLLILEPEELGAKLLILIIDRVKTGNRAVILGQLLNEFAGARSRGDSTYPEAKMEEVKTAITEAYTWLEREILLIPTPNASGDAPWRRPSRRGFGFKDEGDVNSFAISRQLPRQLLHHSISRKVWNAFARGDYDVAVFQAMKAVEVAVRDAAGFVESERGLPMIRKAFQKDSGPLTKLGDDEAEKEAVAHLFAGSYGRFRNPHGHRQVELNDPGEAIEIIMLANHLLRIVDERGAIKSSNMMSVDLRSAKT